MEGINQANLSGNNSFLFQDLHESSINIQNLFYQKKEIPRLLTARPQIPPDTFRGRETDFEDIKNHFKSDQSILLLLNANGGIGKTTLASYFYTQEESQYKHLAWLYCEQGIATTLLGSLPKELGIKINIDTGEILEAFQQLITVLSRLDSKCLLVLDNVNDEEELRKYLPELRSLTNFQILVTSRCRDLDLGITEKRIEPLSPKEAIELFASYYPSVLGKAELLTNLLERVNYNTLVIELLAKNLAVANRNRSNAYTLEQLYEDLEHRGLFNLRKSRKVATPYHLASRKEIKPEELIAAMYDIEGLSAEERTLLIQFSVLPAQAISYALLFEMLGVREEDEDNFESYLDNLTQKGWIDRQNQNQITSYKISPVVQEVVLQAEKPTYKQIESMVTYLNEKLESVGAYLKNTSFHEAMPFAQMAQSVLNHISDLHLEIGILSTYLQDYYRNVGNLQDALKFNKQATAIFQKTHQERYAVSLAKLGAIYQDYGKFEEALKYYEDYNKLGLELFATNSKSPMAKRILANSYERLGTFYYEQSKFDEALEYYANYNRLSKELHQINLESAPLKHLLAISNSKLGEAYQAQDKMDEALIYFEQYHKLCKELQDANPNSEPIKNSLAISLEKLGSIYQKQLKSNKALGYFKERAKIGEELYQANPESEFLKQGLAVALEKLGSIYQSMGDFAEAKDYFEREIKLFEELCQANPYSESLRTSLAIAREKLESIPKLKEEYRSNITTDNNSVNTGYINFYSSKIFILNPYDTNEEDIKLTTSRSKIIEPSVSNENESYESDIKPLELLPEQNDNPNDKREPENETYDDPVKPLPPRDELDDNDTY